MEQSSGSSASQPLRILSLDGGGIRGISSLDILGYIMEEIRKALRLDNTPKPCEHFDLIGGTSTGGIIAIMLGRLGMTVDDCTTAYMKVSKKAFTRKRTAIFPGAPTGAFSATALEEAIKQTIQEFCNEAECSERRRQGDLTIEGCPHSDMVFRNTTCTKTVVLAITKDNVDAPPTRFATYGTSAAFDGCTIWQVARATSAATTFFKSIKVGRAGIEFIDAGFGYNNPCEILIEEAKRQFPGREQMRVLSIGTGLGAVVAIRDNRLPILKALKDMATSSKSAAQRLDVQYGGTDQYYRFNVDKGLEDIRLSDWAKTGTISAHTHNYLEENRREVEKFVHAFLMGDGRGPSGNTELAETVMTAEGREPEPKETPTRADPIRTETEHRHELAMQNGWVRQGNHEIDATHVDHSNAFQSASLFAAIQQQDISATRTLLDEGADAASQDYQGTSALARAVDTGNSDLVALLLERGANPNLAHRSGTTPLIRAAVHLHYEIMKLLLEHHAEVDVSVRGFTALGLCIGQRCLAGVELLIQFGADVNLPGSAKEMPLSLASRLGASELIPILHLAGSNINFAHPDTKRTALHTASDSGRLSCVRALLDAGAQVDMPYRDNRTALHMATEHGHAEIVDVLLRSGANLKSKGSKGETALMYAASMGHFEIVQLILGHGVDMSFEKDNAACSPLWYASFEGHTEVTKLLLQHGAEVNDQNVSGEIPLHGALKNGKLGTFEFLLRQGSDINIRTSYGATAMDIAISHGQAEAVVLLTELVV